MNYLWHPCRVTIHSDRDGVYAVSEVDGTRSRLQWRFIHDSPEGGTTYEFPGLATLLEQGGIPITNAIMASDIRHLAYSVSLDPPDQQYLVRSAQRMKHGWVVKSTYCGSPDDEHRRPSGVVHTLYCNSDWVVTNVTEQVLPRPIDLEKSQNITLEGIPKAASGSRKPSA